MTERDQFVRAICEHPADDVPRLVYADRLDDWGEHDRAEFIRVQCELAQTLYSADRMPEEEQPRTSHSMFCNNTECRHCELDRRGAALPESASGNGYHCWEWMGPAAKSIVPDGARWRDHIDFARGFVSAVRLRLADFLGHAAAIFGEHPVERVELTDRGPHHNAAGCWLWTSSGMPPEHFGGTSIVPTEMFKSLTGDIDIVNRSSWRTYRTRDAATAALSDVLVAYGRAAAGSPAPAPAVA